MKNWIFFLCSLICISRLDAQTSTTFVGDTLVVKVWKVQPVPAVIPPIVIPPDTLPKPVRVVLFDADWSTGPGTNQWALRDSSKAMPFDFCDGNAKVAIIPATGLGFPARMANVMRVTRNNIDSWFFCKIGTDPTGNILKAHWPLLAIGKANYWRVYLRNDIPDSEGDISISGLSHHPIQMPHNSNSFEPTNFFSNADGTMDWEAYTMAPNNAFPWDKAVLGAYVGGSQFGQTLPKFTVLRIEWMVRRDTDKGYSMAVRIYDDQNRLMWSEDGVGASKGTVMNERAGVQSSMKSHDGLYAADPVMLQSLGIGENGGWHSYTKDVYFYFGGLRLCADNWCGPY